MVSVSPERLDRWIAGFAERHAAARCEASPDRVIFQAADGAVADCSVPFPPLDIRPGSPDGGLTAHALRERRVGVLLVRLGGYAAGVFAGSALLASKTGSRHVQGRSAAGGWSQRRFARRREGQARVAYAAAADAAALVLLPEATSLDGLVLGGDKRAVAATLDDGRLDPLRSLVVGPTLDVPEPKRQVLEGAPALFRAVRIRVTDPGGA